MTSRQQAIKTLKADGYLVIPPVPTEDRIVTAATEFRDAAERINDLVGNGGRITPLAADLIQQAANAIHEARDRNELREVAA